MLKLIDLTQKKTNVEFFEYLPQKYRQGSEILEVIRIIF